MVPVWLLVVLVLAGAVLFCAVLFQACTLKHDRNEAEQSEALLSPWPSIYDARMGASLRGTAGDFWHSRPQYSA